MKFILLALTLTVATAVAQAKEEKMCPYKANTSIHYNPKLNLLKDLQNLKGPVVQTKGFK